MCPFSYNISPTDNEAPAFTAIPDIAAVTDNALCDAVVSFNVTAMDNCDSSPTVTCNPPSGSTFSLGLTRVNCSAEDTAGNVVEDYFNVNISGS